MQPRSREDRPLQRGEATRLDVLDRLDQDGAVERTEPAVGVEHRSLHQIDPRRPSRAQGVEPPAQALERGLRHVDADDVGELRLLRQIHEKITVPASEVENGRGAAPANLLADGLQALPMQPARQASPPGARGEETRRPCKGSPGSGRERVTG